MRSLLLLPLFLFSVGIVNGYDILFVAPISSKSHKNFYNGIIQALAEKGHKVTVFSEYPTSKKSPNIEDVKSTGLVFEKHMPNVFKDSGIKPIIHMMTNGPLMCTKTLASKEAQDVINRKFDLAIITLFFSDCYFPVIYKMGIPYVSIMPAGLFTPLGLMMGNPSFPSIAPDIIFNMKPPLSFFGRMKSTLGALIGTFVTGTYMERRMESQCIEENLCPTDVPSISEIKSNSSALIINSVRTMEPNVIPYVPNIIHAGGIHLRPAKELPSDLKKWADDSGDDGFIFFSLGSAAKPSDMPEHHRKTLIKVFASLKQRVLWKWDQESMPDLPKNVKLGKWLPQQDIFGHPKLQLFITHGGLHSTQESIYHGIKVIGMPIFADQMSNMQEVETHGWGRVLTWDDLTFETLKGLIEEVVNNKEMKVVSKKRSELMQDQVIAPDDYAVYWIEYVIRHGGAYHLRSPILDLTWYQLYNTDVWVFLIVLDVLFMVAFFYSIKYCYRCCCSKKKSKKNKRE